jgi:hypothetical protein
MTVKLFLDHQNGAYAFWKEKENATWLATPHREDITAEVIPDDIPANFNDFVDTSLVRRVVLEVQPSSESATWDISIFAGNLVLPAEDRKPSIIREESGMVGTHSLIVDVHGHDNLYVMCTSLSAGTVSVYVGTIDFEDTSS